MNNSEPLISELYQSLSELKRVAMRTREQMLGEHQLTRTQIEVMAVLRGAKHQTIGEVAEYLGVTHSASTQTIETLVKRGLVERFDDDNDRRIVRLALSADGRQLAESLYASHIARLNQAFAGLSEAELTVLISALKRLTHQFNETKTPQGGQ